MTHDITQPARAHRRIRHWFAPGALALALTAAACSGAEPVAAPPGLKELRQTGGTSRDADVVARWTLNELLAPGGTAADARRARKRLDSISAQGMRASLARAVDDTLHGALATAPDHFMEVVRAARASTDPDAPLYAWYAVARATALDRSAPGLWKRWRPFVEEAIADPRAIGWRARSGLVDWWAEEAWAEAASGIEDRARETLGCLQHARLAGPFGFNQSADAFRHFEPERPGAWPEEWTPAPGVGEIPRIIDVESNGCSVHADEPTGDGVYYTEAFVDVTHDAEAILAVQGALAVWVNDELVLDRDPRQWGIWPSFGIGLFMEQGRHRIVARLSEPETSLRLMHADGTPLPVADTADVSRPYGIAQVRRRADPNVLNRYIRRDGILAPADDALRFVAAHLATVEAQNDVASLLLEPLVRNTALATGPALELAGAVTGRDPIFEESQARDLVRELNQLAQDKDAKLWAARLSVVSEAAKNRGLSDSVKGLAALVEEFDQVPAMMAALARVYGELGWKAEHERTLLAMLDRFPQDVDALVGAIEVLDARGETTRVGELMARVQTLEPDAELVLDRALASHDFALAKQELERLGKRRPDREDITPRLLDVAVQAGAPGAMAKKLEHALEEDPLDELARLMLADTQLAAGQERALHVALVDAVGAGADTDALGQAIDMLEGSHALEPYRLDAKRIIAEYEKTGRHMPGTAARVLDYAAFLVNADGSSHMLEHEVIRIQSEEAIGRFAEQEPLAGRVLHMRVIKKDGRVLEPLAVAGKPTVTYPHLEVGDYIETENIRLYSGNSRGKRWSGPRWFFREESVAYARSELVVVSPVSRPVDIETTGDVPAPIVTEDGQTVSRRWRVDFSPAAPHEPLSVPMSEFLPSVRLGWGMDLDEQLERLAGAVAATLPVDPRVRRIAERIVEPLPLSAKRERAKRLYRWVLANVEEGEESDGRRVVVGKRGNRWRGLLMLCRAIGLDVGYAVAQSVLAHPPLGPMSRAEQYSIPLLRVQNEGAPLFLTVSNKYAPFGYVPAHARGAQGVLLGLEERTPTTIPAGSFSDRVTYRGRVKLAADGSAEITLEEQFEGSYAMKLRETFSELPEERIDDILESGLLGKQLPGAKLSKHTLKALDDHDSPLVVELVATVPRFARRQGSLLVIEPPFAPSLSQLATLPSRQTALLLGRADHHTVKLEVELPAGATVAVPASTYSEHAKRRVQVTDQAVGNRLTLERTLDLPAGRVHVEEYGAFVAFTREADAMLSREIRVTLPKDH